MATFAPPPTYADPVLVDEKTRRAKFNPIWLNWFLELTKNLTPSGAGSGSVTSVDLTMPTQYAVSGNPITVAGTLAVAWNTQTANQLLSGPTSGAAALPTFRALVNADFPTTAVAAGSYTYASITVNAQGLLTAASSGTTPVTSIGVASPITSTGGTTPTIGINSSTAATANYVVQRDANANAFANNFTSSATSTASTGGTIALTAASARYQILTGASTETYTLPDATTLTLGASFYFNNNSSGALTVNDHGGSAVIVVPAGGYVQVNCTSIGSSTGTWDGHPLAPVIVQWGGTGLTMNSALTTTPFLSNGVASSTNPILLPQRGTSNTGYSGDATHLYGIIAGAATFTSAATSFTIPQNLTITGATSGSVQVKVPAVAGSNTLTLPAGTTDFSATGGTSQVVKQTSAGGAFTVAQLTYPDLTTSAASVTTLVASDTITPDQTKGIVGTTTNNSAQAGSVGEYQASEVTSVTVNTTVTNITSLSIPKGDWDVTISVNSAGIPGGMTSWRIGLSSTSASFPAGAQDSCYIWFDPVVGVSSGEISNRRVLLSSDTTYYLVGQTTGAAITTSAQGSIRARRAR